jgi:phage gpG-like protein
MARVVINQAAVNALLRSPGGIVGRDMYRRGKNVERVAKRLVGVDSGLLRSKINTEPIMHRGAPGAWIGSRVRYAAVHHSGHGVIRPRRPGGVLVFRPKGSATVVFATRVRAVAGNPYLTKALPAARF